MGIESKNLNRQQIHEILPHGLRFMFLESAEIVIPGIKATGVLADLKRPEFEYLNDHFPNFRVFPGALQLEALAELLCLAYLSGSNSPKDKIGVLTGEKEMGYHQNIFTGDYIKLEAEIIGRIRMGKFGIGKVVAFKNEKIATKGKISFALEDK